MKIAYIVLRQTSPPPSAHAYATARLRRGREVFMLSGAQGGPKKSGSPGGPKRVYEMKPVEIKGKPGKIIRFTEEEAGVIKGKSGMEIEGGPLTPEQQTEVNRKLQDAARKLGRIREKLIRPGAQEVGSVEGRLESKTEEITVRDRSGKKIKVHVLKLGEGEMELKLEATVRDWKMIGKNAEGISFYVRESQLKMGPEIANGVKKHFNIP